MKIVKPTIFQNMFHIQWPSPIPGYDAANLLQTALPSLHFPQTPEEKRRLEVVVLSTLPDSSILHTRIDGPHEYASHVNIIIWLYCKKGG